MHRKPRRILAGVLLVLGGLFMWFAPEVSQLGLALMVLGVLIELVGIFLEHRNGDN